MLYFTLTHFYISEFPQMTVYTVYNLFNMSAGTWLNTFGTS